jgi:hypothetical protein
VDFRAVDHPEEAPRMIRIPAKAARRRPELDN